MITAAHHVPRRPLIALAMLTLLSSAGCAFSDGEPWGWVDVEVENAGYAATSSTITSVDLEVTSIRLLSESSGSSATTELDPANPPPGFSLCHNGHCHADDGRLVPYDEVLQESASGPQVVSAVALDASLSEGSSTSERLKITRQGPLSQVEVELGALELRGTLPYEDASVAFRANVPVRGLRLTMPLDLRVDASSPSEQRLNAQIVLNDDIAAELDLSEATFEDDGSLRVTNTRNRALAEDLLERAALQLTLIPASP